MTELLYGIVNTKGEHTPNDKGELLCNGHCNWNKCNQPRWQCKGCGYIECDICFEDGWDEYCNSDCEPETVPCRNCGVKGQIRELD